MSQTPSDTVHLWADLLVEELVRCGVTFLVLAPGARSTPLVAAAVRNPRMRMQLHVDERGAAFFALGYARATGRPAAWLTTSGTAVANGLPAVVEASADGVPLVLLTADRPPELRDTAANQTIGQPTLFGPYVRWRVDLPVPDPAIDPAYVLTTVDQAVYRSTGVHPGPVHLNAMFRKPLEPASDPRRPGEALGRWMESGSPYTRYAEPAVRPDPGSLVEDLRTARRPLIVAGRLTRPQADAVERLAGRTGWPVVADVLSQLRLGPGGAVRHADLLAAHPARLPLPDAVIEVGRPGVSKRLRAFLGDAGARVRAVLADGPDRVDPDHRVTHRLQGIPDALDALADAPADVDPEWPRAWPTLDGRIAAGLDRWSERTALSEPALARHLAASLPAGQGLFVASSMPVRDLDAFAAPGERPVLVGANRGASGIDGTVASAAGFAAGLGAPVTLLIGDLALLHDLNALALVRDRAVTVVVVNNDGGGIFSFLPIAEHESVFDPWFTAPHGMSFRGAAEQFGLAYEAPTGIGSFREAYGAVSRSGHGGLIEVRTDRTENRRLHAELVEAAGRWMQG